MALFNFDGVTGGVVYIINYVVFKIIFFLCAGSIYVFVHKIWVSEFCGFARCMLWTMVVFVFVSLSVIGILFICGFVFKWYLVLGMVDSGCYIFFVVFLVSFFLNVVYLWFIVFKVYFVKEELFFTIEVCENFWMVVFFVFIVLGSLLLGIFFGFVFDLVGRLML